MAGDSSPAIFPLAGELLAQWENQGWIVIESLFPGSLVTEVAAATYKAGFPPAREFEPVVGPSQFDSMATFPFSSMQANRLATSDTLHSIASQLLGVDEVQLYQAQIWHKEGGVVSYEQTHHRDYAKNTMLTPRDEEGRCDFLAFIVYLTDVYQSCGPTALVSRAIYDGAPLEPARFHPDEAPELYSAERRICAQKGTTIFYAGDVFHRATEVRRGSSRLVLKGAVRKTAATWVSYVHGLRIGFEPEWSIFVNQASSTALKFLLGRHVSDRLGQAKNARYRRS